MAVSGHKEKRRCPPFGVCYGKGCSTTPSRKGAIPGSSSLPRARPPRCAAASPRPPACPWPRPYLPSRSNRHPGPSRSAPATASSARRSACGSSSPRPTGGRVGPVPAGARAAGPWRCPAGGPPCRLLRGVGLGAAAGRRRGDPAAPAPPGRWDILRGQAPGVVREETWAHLLADNLVRGLPVTQRIARPSPKAVNPRALRLMSVPFTPVLLCARSQRGRRGSRIRFVRSRGSPARS
jgi:hypothetical protein